MLAGILLVSIAFLVYDACISTPKIYRVQKMKFLIVGLHEKITYWFEQYFDIIVALTHPK